ncbi:GFA family protein [Rhizobium sp. AAP43]|uniref:GFA family protein n=1 Tax=Rhizobium sp. AAP43 TaxID=1523420 RepID=UPI0006B99808|nr:GFA family protein [Rhizobium sp. AAP43]KPF47366.1 aldehyde-activating protein [Rhizobium sp. AAP43]
MDITGACQCGAIRYAAEIDPALIGICHCTDCQRLTGSAYRVTAACLPDQLRLKSGRPRRYRKIGDSGQPSDQFFCGDCGSPLWRESADGKIGIRLGTIDQRRELRPHHQSWMGSALPFVFDIGALERHEDS